MKYGEAIQEGDTIEILEKPKTWADHTANPIKYQTIDSPLNLRYPVEGIVLEKNIFRNTIFTHKPEFYCALIEIDGRIYGFSFRNKVNYKIINSKNNFNQSII